MFRIGMSPSTLGISSPFAFLVSFEMLTSIELPSALPRFFGRLSAIVSSVIPITSTFAWAISSLWATSTSRLIPTTGANATPVVASVPATERIIDPHLVFLFLFVVLASFLLFSARRSSKHLACCFIGCRGRHQRCRSCGGRASGHTSHGRDTGEASRFGL